MLAREKTEEPVREANQGICIKCRRALPASAFLRDVTGNLTAWCNVCREEAAKNWAVDVDQVELIRCLYTFEKFLTNEAEAVMRARITLGVAVETDMEALRVRIHRHHLIRHSRIPGRLRQLLKEYREGFYAAVVMDLPNLEVLFPAPHAVV